MRNESFRIIPWLLMAVSGFAVGGCVVPATYTTTTVRPAVVVESYAPRWYDGRYVYYRDGGWGYYVRGAWYPYPASHPIYVVHRYPHATRTVVVDRYRPAVHRGHRVNSHRYDGVTTVCRPAARPGHTVRGTPARQHHRPANLNPQRRGDRVRAGQPSQTPQGQPQGQARDRSRRSGGGTQHPPSASSGQR